MDLLHLTGGFSEADLSIFLNLTSMKRRVFDETFRQMARPGVPVDLSCAKGPVREAAEELGRWIRAESVNGDNGIINLPILVNPISTIGH